MIVQRPRDSVGRVCVIGGTGAVGQSLIPLLSQSKHWQTTYYAASDHQHCRLLASFQDHLTNALTVSNAVDSILDADTVILLAGERTSKGGSKDGLFEANRSIAHQYLPYLNDKNLLVVSNPCTRLARHLQQRLDAFVVGVGVQNDYNRIRYQCPTVEFIIGAHNLNELQLFDKQSRCLFDGFSNHATYQTTKSLQDELIGNGENAALRAQLTRPDMLRWWRLQRFHTLANTSAHACARAIAQWLDTFAHHLDELIHGEVMVQPKGRPAVFLGVPLKSGKLYCSTEVVEHFLDQNKGYVDRYAS